MRTVALISMKGGSGKSTAAVHLATAAAQQGRNVVLLDLDPQQSASKWGDRRRAAEPLVLMVPPSRLAHHLQRCADAGADLAILDTPPRAGSHNAAQVAARAADLVLLPCRPSVLDVEAVADTAARGGPCRRRRCSRSSTRARRAARMPTKSRKRSPAPAST